MFLTSSDTRRTDASIIVYKFRPDVRIVYATAINFPCIITLGKSALYVSFKTNLAALLKLGYLWSIL